MPSAASKDSFAAQLRALGDVAPADFDVEDAERLGGGSDEGSIGDVSEDESEGRAHYVEVGRSHLRRSEIDRPAGAAYTGKRASRAELYDGGDSDSDQDGLSGDEDADGLDDLLEDGGDEESDLTGSEDVSVDDFDSDDDDQQSDDGSVSSASSDGGEQAEEAKRLVAEDRAALVQEVTKRATADVEKGKAVKRQLQVFESLLDTRIKLQKALQAANLYTAASHEGASGGDEDHTAVASAEKSCLELIESLLSVRDDMLARDIPEYHSNASQRKRKYDQLEVEDIELSEVWSDVCAPRESVATWRTTVLSKWAGRVSASSGAAGNKGFKALGRLDNPTFGVVAQLDEAKSDREKLLKRTQIPRYRASTSGDADMEELVAETYDDGDFYSELLRELIDSRTLDSVGGGETPGDVVSGGARTAATRNAQHEEQRRRQLASRNGVPVDTRASKGRKLRHHVHEKLQNFVAPDTTVVKWHDAQIDELFGSLLGQSVRIVEDDDEESDVESDTEVPIVAGEDFRLFG